jgi:hypothetical protein
MKRMFVSIPLSCLVALLASGCTATKNTGVAAGEGAKEAAQQVNQAATDASITAAAARPGTNGRPRIAEQPRAPLAGRPPALGKLLLVPGSASGDSIPIWPTFRGPPRLLRSLRCSLSRFHDALRTHDLIRAAAADSTTALTVRPQAEARVAGRDDWSVR